MALLCPYSLWYGYKIHLPGPHRVFIAAGGDVEWHRLCGHASEGDAKPDPSS